MMRLTSLLQVILRGFGDALEEALLWLYKRKADRTLRNVLKDLISGKAPLTAKRSSEWKKVRANFLAVNPTCAACGGKEKIEVHHRVPFYIAPELELDPANLITLCESKKHGINCHLFVGHAGNYKSYREDVHIWANIIYHSFYSSSVRFQREVSTTEHCP